MPKKISIYQIKPGKVAKIKTWFNSLAREKRFEALIAFEKTRTGREFGTLIKINGQHYAIFFDERRMLGLKSTSEDLDTEKPPINVKHEHIIKECLRFPALTITQPDYDLCDNLL